MSKKIGVKKPCSASATPTDIRPLPLRVVEALRRGKSLRFVARHFGVPITTAYRWQQRAKGQRPCLPPACRLPVGRQGRQVDRVVWKTPRSRSAKRTPGKIENVILSWRKKLAENRRDYPLGEIGAAAIARKIAPIYGNLPAACLSADRADRSAKFVAEHLREHAAPPNSAPSRRPFPTDW